MQSQLTCWKCEGPAPDSAERCPRCGADLSGGTDEESSGPSVLQVPRPPRPLRADESGPTSWTEEFDKNLRLLKETPADVGADLPPIDEEIHRIPTYVRGLDGALGGGIPAGYVVLLEGSPGTMKSSLAFWVLAHNAAHDGRRGVYLSFEESAGSLLRQMRSLGVSLGEAADRLIIAHPADLAPAIQRAKGDWLEALGRVIEPLCRNGLEMMVLDSLEALDMIVGFRDRRDQMFRLFEWLRDLRLTSLIIAERSEASLDSRDSRVVCEEDYLADGIIQLRLHPIGRIDVHRRLRIYKMRGVRHETDYLAFHAGSGELEVVRILGG